MRLNQKRVPYRFCLFLLLLAALISLPLLLFGRALGPLLRVYLLMSQRQAMERQKIKTDPKGKSNLKKQTKRTQACIWGMGGWAVGQKKKRLQMWIMIEKKSKVCGVKKSSSVSWWQISDKEESDHMLLTSMLTWTFPVQRLLGFFRRWMAAWVPSRVWELRSPSFSSSVRI